MRLIKTKVYSFWSIFPVQQYEFTIHLREIEHILCPNIIKTSKLVYCNGINILNLTYIFNIYVHIFTFYNILVISLAASHVFKMMILFIQPTIIAPLTLPVKYWEALQLLPHWFGLHPL